ncbi:MAG: hypothetical protein ACI8XO_002759 [Verrucomicrobiales bacterium]
MDERGKDSVFPDGSLDQGIIHATTVRLQKKQVEELIRILTTEPSSIDPPARCYDPHHAFVFYNDDWNVVASIDLCLMCNGSQERSLKVANDLDFTHLQKFVAGAGLPVLAESSGCTKFFEREDPN